MTVPNLTQGRSLIDSWRKDPVKFVKEALGVEPDPWQLDPLTAFTDSQRIAMITNKGCGKTTILAWIILLFMATRPHPKVICTSITRDNLSDGLWSEIAKWQGKNPFLSKVFEWTKTTFQSKEFPATWFAAARQWSRSASNHELEQTLAGKHQDYMLFIIDEAGGVPDAVVATAEASLAAGIECKLVLAGNPVMREGPLYRAATNERHLWHVVRVTGDPDDPNRSPRVPEKWAREQIEKYGRDNPWVKVNVFGEFPDANFNSLLGPDDVAKARNRNPDMVAVKAADIRMGIDVARFGDAKTVLFTRQGMLAHPPVEMRGARTDEIASRAIFEQSQIGRVMTYVDDTGGYGAGVVDCMLRNGSSPIPINFSGKADDPRYFNKRSEMWFRMAEWVKRGGCLPQDDELAAELSVPTYTFFNGKFRLEEKEQIKERIGRSPDKADALALTFATSERPAEVAPFPLVKKTTASGEYDPISPQAWDYVPR